jgi:hypothetical protein
MIVKKEGVINEIIYSNTVYHNGEYRIYPTISDLKSLVQEIINSRTTTAYIRITPFYNNAKLDEQIEFDEYMFYMECRDKVNNESVQRHIASCFGKEYDDLNREEVRLGKILFPLCDFNDVETYKKSIEDYIEFLNELIPLLWDISKSKMDIKEEHFAFGYFCFEVHSE